jgi:glycosyltransferase involved in cell wall biosynthesis
MATPILSILIATRNRVRYCINAIESILDFEYENFELIIQDNSDTSELQKYISNRVIDDRLVYNYTPPPFSSIDNFNEVIALAKGEYLCVIGDDDGVTNEIFTLVEWMKANSIAAVKPNLRVMYLWPDACEILPNFKVDKGNLELQSFTGRVEVFDVKKELIKLLKNGFQDYLDRQLPKLYHGVVSREQLVAIKDNCGNYTGGLSPDIYWVVSLANLIENIVVIDYPITIPGASYSALERSHVKSITKLEDAPHFRERGNYEWSKVIPRFYCAENMWAVSAYRALVDNKMTVEIDKFNLLYLSSLLFIKYEEKQKIITDNFIANSNHWILKKYPRSFIVLNVFKLKLQSNFDRIIRKFKKIFTGGREQIFERMEFRNVDSIKEATELIVETLKSNNISLESVLKSSKFNSGSK